MYIYIHNTCIYTYVNIYMWTIRLIRRTRAHTHTHLGWGFDPWRSLVNIPNTTMLGYIYIYISIYLSIYIIIFAYIYTYWKLLEDSAMLQLPQQLAQTNLLQENHLGLSQNRNEPKLDGDIWWSNKKEKQWEIIGFLWVPYFDICLEEKMNLYIEWKHSISVPTWHIHKSGVYTLNFFDSCIWWTPHCPRGDNATW